MGWLANGDPHGCSIEVLTLNETFKSWGETQRIPLRLISNGRLIINPPSVKTNYVDVAGKNGKLDMTEVLTGFPLYNNRTGTLNFIVDNTVPGAMTAYDQSTWVDRYQNILEVIHGNEVQLTLDDDPDYFYKGRMSVNSWSSGNTWSQIALDYDFEPYKYSKSYMRLDITLTSDGEKSVKVTRAGTEEPIFTTSDPVNLVPYLDLMPVQPPTIVLTKNTAGSCRITMKNSRLSYNKYADFTETGILWNPYRLQSFVMTKQLATSPSAACTIDMSGASARLTMKWYNGRL